MLTLRMAKQPRRPSSGDRNRSGGHERGPLAPEEAVKKIVSVFDACCRDWAAQLATLPMRPRRRKELLEMLFHGIDAAEVLKRTFDIELLKGMDHETGFLRLMFQRRHVFEHEGGVATSRYLNESGDKSITEGTLTGRLARTRTDWPVARCAWLQILRLDSTKYFLLSRIRRQNSTRHSPEGPSSRGHRCLFTIQSARQ